MFKIIQIFAVLLICFQSSAELTSRKEGTHIAKPEVVTTSETTTNQCTEEPISERALNSLISGATCSPLLLGIGSAAFKTAPTLTGLAAIKSLGKLGLRLANWVGGELLQSLKSQHSCGNLENSKFFAKMNLPTKNILLIISILEVWKLKKIFRLPIFHCDHVITFA